ncbi:MAG: GNAT family N-acetyltransferase [Actinomycetota bacterium]
MILVRPAQPADAGVLAAHDAASAAEASSYRGRPEPTATSTEALVAVLDGTPIGSLTFTVEQGTWTVVRCYVEPEFRGVGTGDDLVGQFLAAARGAGARRVAGSALPGDRATKNLFERNGLVARLILVERELD